MTRTRAVAYLRVSTEKQADKGVSLDAQRAKVEAYAQLYELELVDIVIDAGVSAKTLDRAGLQRALEMLKAGQAEALLVGKFERLTRSGVHLRPLAGDSLAEVKWELPPAGWPLATTQPAGSV